MRRSGVGEVGPRVAALPFCVEQAQVQALRFACATASEDPASEDTCMASSGPQSNYRERAEERFRAEEQAFLAGVPTEEMRGRLRELRLRQLELELENQALRALAVGGTEVRSDLCGQECRWQELAEAMPLLVWVTGPGGVCEYASRQWVAYTGGEPGPGPGGDWLAPVHPEQREQARVRWQESLTTGQRLDLELRFRRADGTYRWFEAHVVPVRDASGEVARWIGSCADVDARKGTEAELRQSERLYRAIAESIDYGVWVCAPDGRNTYASESFLRLVGLTQDQCSNFGWGAVLHPDDSARTIAAWKECVRTGGVWDIEHRFRGVDGEWHAVLARGVPVRDEAGAIQCWAGINLDIQRLKQAQLDLETARVEAVTGRNRLQAIMDSLPVGVAIADAAGGIVAVNRAYEEVWGDLRPVARAVRDYAAFRGWWSQSGEPVAPEDWASARAVQRGETVVGQLLEIQRFDGSRAFVHNSAAPVRDAEGRITGCAVAIMDITDHHRVQMERERLLEALAEQRATLNVIMEHTRTHLAYLDTDFHYVHANTTYAAGCGLAPERLVGRSYFSLFPDDANRSLFQRVVSEGRPVEFQAQGFESPLRPGRANTYWDWTLVPVKDANDRTRGLVLSLLDVTAAKRAELALRQSEARFRGVYDSNLVPLFFWRRDGCVTDGNDAYLRLVGRPRIEVSRGELCWRDLLPSDSGGLQRRKLRELAQRGTCEPFETTYGLPDGRRVPVLLGATALPEAPDQGVAFAIDLTDRKRSEEALRRAHADLELRVKERTQTLRETVHRLELETQAHRATVRQLRESEERYRALFELAPAGILLSDFTGRVRGANQALCAALGYPAEELEAVRAGQLYDIPHRTLLAMVRRKGRVDEVETRMRRKDGSFFPVALQLSVVDLQGRRAVLTLVQDLTRRKQAEQRIQGVATLLGLFAMKTSRQEYLDAAVELLQRWCQCRMVGIRLLTADGRMPYAASIGFSKRFLRSENALRLETARCICARALQSQKAPEEDRCQSGRCSFFCNHLGGFLARPANRRGRPAGHGCMRDGFESLAQVPISFQGKVVGAIYVADPRPGRMPQPTVEFIESVAPIIGEALHRFRLEDNLRESESRFRSLFESHDAVMLLLEPDTGRIVDANPAAARFYGHGRERLRSLRVGDLDSRPRGAGPGETRLEVAADGGCFVVSQRLARGEERTVEVYSSAVTVGGQRLLFAIIHDVTERMQLEKRVLEAGDQERQRMGQDLHDSLGGHLAGVALVGQALTQRLAGTSEKGAVALAEEIVRGLNDAVTQTRSIARGLCPVGLGTFGLVSGLQEYAASIARRFKVRCRFVTRGTLGIADEVTASHLYRITQEAVNNAVRHGKPRHLRIQLIRRGAGLELGVRDDGRGMPQRRKPGLGMGLRTMRYRADVIGARLEIHSRPGKGTEVRCWLADITPGGKRRTGG